MANLVKIGVGATLKLTRSFLMTTQGMGLQWQYSIAQKIQTGCFKTNRNIKEKS